jgi:Ca2+:H+ antiporter
MRMKALRWTGANLPSVTPVIAVITLLLSWGRPLGIIPVVLIAVILGAAVLAAVHHAEVIAHRVGEPFGSLILAVAVTIIEVALIITLVTSGGEKTETLARDTVFAAVMITMNGIVGVSLLAGALRHGIVRFNAEGAGALLASVTALAVLTLVLPTFTTSASGPQFSASQLAFAAVASVAIYGMFIATQTVTHRDFFLPVEITAVRTMVPARATIDAPSSTDDNNHAAAPSNRAAWLSVVMLTVALVATVGLAKVESPSIEAAVKLFGFPPSFVGVVIALLVLLPESIAAVRAARRNRIQTSLNLALGSAMASIGLTIPAIAVATLWIEGPLVLGLEPTQIVLLMLTVVVSILTIAPGRATRLQGGVHLVLFGAFLFLSIVP